MRCGAAALGGFAFGGIAVGAVAIGGCAVLAGAGLGAAVRHPHREDVRLVDGRGLLGVPDLVGHAQEVVVHVSKQSARVVGEGLLVHRIQDAIQEPAARIHVAPETGESLLDRIELFLHRNVRGLENQLLELFDLSFDVIGFRLVVVDDCVEHRVDEERGVCGEGHAVCRWAGSRGQFTRVTGVPVRCMNRSERLVGLLAARPTGAHHDGSAHCRGCPD